MRCALWKWPDNPRYSKKNEKVNIAVLLLCLTFWFAWVAWGMVGHTLFTTLIPVNVLLNRAGRDIVVRFPPQAGVRQEDVFITSDIDIDGSVVASRVFVTHYGEAQRGPSIALSTRQWMAWDMLRREWCRHPPPDTVIPEPAFEIGINCPKDIKAPLSLIFRMPPTALPATLRILLQDIPSPGCADPLCGW